MIKTSIKYRFNLATCIRRAVIRRHEDEDKKWSINVFPPSVELKTV